MFSKKDRSQAASTSLDLSSLGSYSPNWSPHLRLATCISIKYAVQRHVERATHLTNKTGPASGSISVSQEWSDYGTKFLTATCQHLGVPENTLPPNPISLEDVLSAAQGRLEHADTSDPICQNEPALETGSDHARRFPHLDLPIKGVDDAKKDNLTDEAGKEKTIGAEEKTSDPSVLLKD